MAARQGKPAGRKRHPHGPPADLRQGVAHPPQPSAPIEQQTVAVDAQHATDDLGSVMTIAALDAL
jgi:hypothetical protein